MEDTDFDYQEILELFPNSDIDVSKSQYWLYDNNTVLLMATKTLSEIFEESIETGDFEDIISATDKSYWDNYIDSNLHWNPDYDKDLFAESNQSLVDLELEPEWLLCIRPSKGGYDCLAIVFNRGLMKVGDSVGQPFSQAPRTFEGEIGLIGELINLIRS